MSEPAANNLVPVDGSGAMFDRIAKRYDMLNRLMSFGIDRIWRRKLLNALPENGRILDVATGTADVAIAIADSNEALSVIGLDPSVGMLEVGVQKVYDYGLQDQISLEVGDAQHMAYPDDHFAGSCISFGIRNVPDRVLGLSEMTRVTAPGGTVVVLELSEPKGGIMAALARFHVHHMVPIMGAIISGDKEYRYLQKSIQAFPDAPDFVKLMEEAGLTDVTAERLTFGTAHLYIGHVPQAAA
jgi:demethylmenaquinone methyltransferase/2-methoxy-6-polyprenyl-1,4-benzoquinol methylase